MSTPPDPPSAAPPDALATALRQLLGPIARLALARGVTHATLDELVKQALVDDADQAHQALPPHRRVSRISTATGIHRREVTRLVAALREGAARQAPPARSLASELFTHWRSHAAYCDAQGAPAALPRQGPAPSFESLAQAITRDVHPRSLLDELLRLGVARHDPGRDTVALVREGFVPQGDQARVLQILGRNVGAHLAGAVDNVLHQSAAAAAVPGALQAEASAAPPHFEQAIYADGLSAESLAEVRRQVNDQWRAMLQALVPLLEDLVARDAATAPADGYHQLRLGLYSHARAAPPADPGPPNSEPPAPPETPDEPHTPR